MKIREEEEVQEDGKRKKRSFREPRPDCVSVSTLNPRGSVGEMDTAPQEKKSRNSIASVEESKDLPQPDTSGVFSLDDERHGDSLLTGIDNIE